MDERTAPSLRRTLNLPLLVLYGVGTIVGGGFYALLGKVAGHAGSAAPTAVALASVVAFFSVLTFAELSSRYPESGGPVAYVRAAFRREWLANLVGVLVILTGVVSAATLTHAVGGFLNELYGVPELVPVLATVLSLGALAVWGIRESALFAAVATVVETGGLLAVLWVRRGALADVGPRFSELVPASAAELVGVSLGGFVAFYAFIGFEDLVTLAEEAKHPRRDLPRAMILALITTTLLYAGVAAVAVLSADPSALAATDAPLAHLVGAKGEASRHVLVWVGVLAALNGLLVQIVMAARILYGMRRSTGKLAWLASLNPRTRTPARATVLLSIVVLFLAVAVPLVALARWTSGILLAVFAMAHAALVVEHRRRPAQDGFRCARWVPVVGFLLCVVFLAAQLVLGA